VRIKTYNLLRILSARHRLHLLSFYESGRDEPEKATQHLSQFCNVVKLIPFKTKKLRKIRVLLNTANVFKSEPFFAKQYCSGEMKSSIIEFIKNNPLDIVHCDTICVAQYVNQTKDRLPAILSLNDSLALCCREEAILFPLKNFGKKIQRRFQWIDAFKYETNLCPQFEKCHVVAQTDKNYLKKLNSKIDVDVIPNGVDTDFFRPLNLAPHFPSLIFEGAMRGGAADYAKWFIDYCLPLVTQVFEDVKLFLVGKEPDRKLLKIATQNKNIIVTGFVEDVRPYIDKATISISPVLRSSGILNKVLQAMAMEKTVVGTPYSFCGVPGCVHGQHIIQAENPYEFAAAIINLLQDCDKRRQIGKNARVFVKNNFTWKKTAAGFESLYKNAIEKCDGSTQTIIQTNNVLKEAAVCKN
jgi:glycosyltransferase involved in cell wall biosynthesis